MSTEQIREEFERTIRKRLGSLIDFTRNTHDEYIKWDAAVAWISWQASRAALVVTLPKDVTHVTNKPYEEGRDDVISAVEKAGITVKE